MEFEASTLKNILANYGGKAWGFLSIFIFIPLYIRYLGVEAYAVIGFYTLIMGMISFADAGLSSAVTREFSKTNTSSYKYSILLIVERIYTIICISLVIIIYILAPLISTKWLTANAIPNKELVYYIRWIGAGVATQLLSTVFFGGLMGLQAQISANVSQVIWSLFRTLGAIVLFILYKPTLEAFFVWQFICNVVYVVSLRVILLKHLKVDGQKIYKMMSHLPMEVWRYIGGMTLVAIISAINMQIDKIVTSSFFTLKQFGHYNLASTLSTLPALVGTPLAVTIFPLFTRLISLKETDALKTAFEKFAFLLNILIIPLGFGLLLYTKDLIQLWTGRNTFSQRELHEMVFIARWLTSGGVFMTLQMMPFYLLLAKGKTKYTIFQGLIQIVFILPALYFSVLHWGLSGAGIPWFIINFSAFVYLYIVVLKKELKLFCANVLYRIVGWPFIINFMVFILFYLLLPKTNPLISLIIIGVSSAVSLLLNIMIYNRFLGKDPCDFRNFFTI